MAKIGDSAADSGSRKDSADEISRRSFLSVALSSLTVAWLSFAAIVMGSVAGLVRFLFPNVLFEPPQSFRAGVVDEYLVGEVSTRWKDQFGVWIIRDEEALYALSTTCTHLGCTPNWLVAEQKFKCPCHGSGFRMTGINFEGPAPRPLERYSISLGDDGQIVIDKTKKFQWEKGEWSDPASFLAV